jgi:hypothetical protein
VPTKVAVRTFFSSQVMSEVPPGAAIELCTDIGAFKVRCEEVSNEAAANGTPKPPEDRQMA